MSCDPFFNLDARNHISGTAEATVAKFCMQVEYIKWLAFDGRLLPNRRGQGEVTRFLKFATIMCLELVEAMHFKFRVLIDTQEYKCMHNILPPKGMSDVSRDLLKFWETSRWC